MVGQGDGTGSGRIWEPASMRLDVLQAEFRGAQTLLSVSVMGTWKMFLE